MGQSTLPPPLAIALGLHPDQPVRFLGRWPLAALPHADAAGPGRGLRNWALALLAAIFIGGAPRPTPEVVEPPPAAWGTIAEVPPGVGGFVHHAASNTIRCNGVTAVGGFAGPVRWDRMGACATLHAPHGEGALSAVLVALGESERVVQHAGSELLVWELASPVAEWCADDSAWLGGDEDLLSFLAAGRHASDEDRTAAQAWLRARPSDETDWEDRARGLDAHIGRTIPAAAPEAEEEVAIWIERVARLRKAAVGAQELAREGSGFGAVHGVLTRRSEAACAAVHAMPDRWKYEREFGLVLFPDDEKPPAGIASPGTDPASVIRAWVSGGLHIEDSARLRALIRAGGPFHDAYKGWLEAAFRPLKLSRPLPFDPPDGIPALRVPLPHHEDGAVFELRVTADGVEGNFFGEVYPHKSGNSIGPLRHEVAPGVTVSLSIEWCDPAIEDRAEAAIRAIEEDSGSGLTRSLGAGLDLARITLPALRPALEQVATSFREGTDPDPAALAQVTLALRGRLAASAAAVHVAGNPGAEALEKELQTLDQSFSDLGAAILALGDGDYETAIGDDADLVDTGAWWGLRAHVDQAVPTRVVERLIRTSRRGA